MVKRKTKEESDRHRRQSHRNTSRVFIDLAMPRVKVPVQAPIRHPQAQP